MNQKLIKDFFAFNPSILEDMSGATTITTPKKEWR